MSKTTVQIVTVPARKPRNPFVAAAFRSGAGCHRRAASGARHQARVMLQRELRDLHPHEKHRHDS
jgi:hypothetical protein